MSHGDAITAVRTLHGHGTSAGARWRPCTISERRLFGLQFHPEVVHTDRGSEIFEHFLIDVCGCLPGWTHVSIIEQQVAAVQGQVRHGSCAVRAERRRRLAVARPWCTRRWAISSVRLRRHRLMRSARRSGRGHLPAPVQNDLVHVKAPTVTSRAGGRHDPERKRKIIGELFIRIFEEVARDLGAGSGHRRRRYDRDR